MLAHQGERKIFAVKLKKHTHVHDSLTLLLPVWSMIIEKFLAFCRKNPQWLNQVPNRPEQNHFFSLFQVKLIGEMGFKNYALIQGESKASHQLY